MSELHLYSSRPLTLAAVVCDNVLKLYLLTPPRVRPRRSTRRATSGPWLAMFTAPSSTVRRSNRLKGFEDFYLNAKARIWPWLSYVCHVRSTAGNRMHGWRRPPHPPLRWYIPWLP